MKPNYVGTIHKIKVLTTYPEMLVRFSLQTQKETINCIISKKNWRMNYSCYLMAQNLLFMVGIIKKATSCGENVCAEKEKYNLKSALFERFFNIFYGP